MSWQCVVCNNFNLNYKDWCYHCLSFGIKVIRTSTFFDLCEESNLEIFIEKISRGKIVTEKEKLFAELFNSEKLEIKDLSDMDLRARREKFQTIAFEARARSSAIDDEERSRRKNNKATGFVKNLEPDDVATEAINKINQRQGKLTKQQKLIESMKKIGIDTSDAEKLMQAGVVKARLDNIAAKKAELDKQKTEDSPSITQALDNILNLKEEPKKPFSNPFAK